MTRRDINQTQPKGRHAMNLTRHNLNALAVCCACVGTLAMHPARADGLVGNAGGIVESCAFGPDGTVYVWLVGAFKKIADAGQFPRKITNFNDIAIDAANGDLYVSDSGDWEGGGGAIFVRCRF